MKKLILFILILFFQSNSNANANECNMSSYEGLANCSIEYIKGLCPIGLDSTYNNSKVTNRLGKTNLRLSSFESPDCNGRFNKILNRSPDIYIFTENNSSEVSWVRVNVGLYNFDKEKKLHDAFKKKYKEYGLFPYPDGYKLFLEGKISHLIFFFDNMTKGIQLYREANGMKVDNLKGFEMSLLYFNSSSKEKINANIEHFLDLNKKLNFESGTGSQL